MVEPISFYPVIDNKVCVSKQFDSNDTVHSGGYSGVWGGQSWNLECENKCAGATCFAVEAVDRTCFACWLLPVWYGTWYSVARTIIIPSTTLQAIFDQKGLKSLQLTKIRHSKSWSPARLVAETTYNSL